MKKTSLVLAFVLIIVGLLITRVSAIDMNLINSIRQNEISAEENLSAVNTNSSVSLNALNNSTLTNTNTSNRSSNTYTNSASNSSTTLSNTSVATVSSTQQTQSQNLTASDIFNVILIVIGVLIILLGIAILIRLKRS